MVEAFILKSRTLLRDGLLPSPEQVYDIRLQLWVNRTTGVAVVNYLSNDLCASQFGETSLTKTSGEGVDQSGGVLHLSQFGETTITRTSGEAADHSSEVLHLNLFSEAAITAINERSDSAELDAISRNALNSLI